MQCTAVKQAVVGHLKFSQIHPELGKNGKE